MNSQEESSKSGSSSSCSTSVQTESPKQASAVNSSSSINFQHIAYQDALKLHQLYTEKKKLTPQKKKKTNGSWFILYAWFRFSKPKADDEKNERDSRRLCRESKDSLDTIWDLLKDIQWDVKSWSLQISGTVSIASTTHYTQNGILRCDFSLPV